MPVAEPLARLLVVRLGSLGDLVHTLPAVAALRRAHPLAQIDWFVDRVHREFLDLVPAISSVVTLRRPTTAGWLEARRELRQRRYEVAIDFQGLIKSAVLARLSGASRVIGFDRASARESLAALFYTERVNATDAGHVIEKNLRLAARAGASTDVREFPLAPPTSPALAAIRREIPGAFVLLNCGAAWPNKRWPADRFGRIAAWLQQVHGLRSVVLWGPGEEAVAADVARASGGAAMVAPSTGLPGLVAVAREARLMLSGDTGPTHIAAAVGTPVVGLFGPTSPARNGPWDSADQVLSRYDTCVCHYERRCRHGHGDAWCLGTIGESEVREAIEMRLRSVSR